MAERRNWTWDETLVAFRLYCRTPFGKLHRHNPDIIALAEKINRTPSAVGQKACNFASLDPALQARGIKGLSNRSRLDEEVWERFHADSEAVAEEAERAYARIVRGEGPQPPEMEDATLPDGPTDAERLVRVRRVQGFFRSAVFISYGHACALTGLAVPALLNASHIVPWSASSERRADPRNGLCLNALHDRAFDRGLMTLDEELRVVISPTLAEHGGLGDLAAVLPAYAGRPLRLPGRFTPDAEALAYHREHVFQAR